MIMPLLNQYLEHQNIIIAIPIGGLEIFYLLGNGWINSLLGIILNIGTVGLNT